MTILLVLLATLILLVLLMGFASIRIAREYERASSSASVIVFPLPIELIAPLLAAPAGTTSPADGTSPAPLEGTARVSGNSHMGSGVSGLD